MIDRSITKQSLLKEGYREMQRNYFEKISGGNRQYAVYCVVCGMASDKLTTEMENNSITVKCEFCPSTTKKFLGNLMNRYTIIKEK